MDLMNSFSRMVSYILKILIRMIRKMDLLKGTTRMDS